MTSVYLLPALPLAAVASGIIFLASARFGRLRWAALTLCTLSLPVLAVLVYRFRDHHVGPGTFSLWRFEASPAAMSFLLPLALVSPLFLWAAQNKTSPGKRQNAASALGCLGIAAALAAVMGDHLFLLAGMLALATWCMAGAAVLRGREAGRLLPYMFPLFLADLCMALGVLFIYLSDPAGGLFYPAAPLEPAGMLAASCALMLAAALLRLGCFPLHRWMAGISRGGKDLRLLHLFLVNMTLGAFLLFAVTRFLFDWGGVWVWVCLGVGGLTLAEVARELLRACGREEALGLLCAALGASMVIVAAPGSQAAAAAARLGLYAGIPALALVELGGEGRRQANWAGVVGSASLLGLPPLAGFAWLWAGFGVMAGEFTTGVTLLFLAAVPILFAGALVMGATSLFLPRGGGEVAPGSVAAAVLLAACCAAVGLYPGAMVDLLMREYGLPLDIPFSSWTSLGWAVLMCAGIAALTASAWHRRRAGDREARMHSASALPLLASRRTLPFRVLEKGRVRTALVLGEIPLLLAWAAAMVYLGFK